MYKIEEIPDTDKLFYRIHPNWVVDGEIIPGAFREVGDGMSTAWSKYSTPTQLQKRASSLVNIISLEVRPVRSIGGLEVIHAPLYNQIEQIDDQAHSLVKGIPKQKILRAKVRDSLIDIANWEIKIA